MISGTINIRWSVNGSPLEQATITKSEEAEEILNIENLDATSPIVSAEYDVALDVSHIELLVINANRDCDLYTNAANGTGGNHLVLKADEPAIWWSNATHSNPLTLDVTKVYLDCSAGTPLSLNLSAIVKPTP